MITTVSLETTSLSFLVFLAAECMVHQFVLQMQQTKRFSLESEKERSKVTFYAGLRA